MAKVTAWVFAIIGILMVLAALGMFNVTDVWFTWVVAVGLLVVAIGKFMRSYKRR